MQGVDVGPNQIPLFVPLVIVEITGVEQMGGMFITLVRGLRLRLDTETTWSAWCDKATPRATERGASASVPRTQTHAQGHTLQVQQLQV